MSDPVIYAFGLTVLAGLSTVLGSFVAFFVRKGRRAFFSVALGFSGGMMIYLSFVEIMPKARDAMQAAFGEQTGYLYTLLAFFAGIAVILIIDMMIPEHENPHHSLEDAGKDADYKESKDLLRVGIMSAVAIAIHNFPEGLATFISALDDPDLGLTIAAAIAIHNIPEGIAVAIPVFAATKSRKKAFWYTFLSGISEPVGAAIGYMFLRPFLSDALLGGLLAAVAGVMVYVSMDGMIPSAHKFGNSHLAIYGTIAGMVVISFSLLLFL